MSSDGFELFTRKDVLEGLFGGHARAASTVLFAIESRTAHLVAQSQQAMERFLTEEAAEKRELAFLEAMALGREPPLRPTIQDLERYAPQWAPLVPENPRVQAAVAHLLGQKYDFTYQAVPGIRATLSLNEEAVQQTYQRLYHEPLETIFAPRTTLAGRLRWAWAALAGWLESLPPFWTAFALTLTETVGAGILALPIALADVGPLAGVAILVVMGLANVLTIAYMAEAVARSGTIRYGSAFLGRVVTDYLGPAGSLILSLGLIVACVLTLWSYYIGLSTTLANATRIAAPVWVALLFLIGLYYLRRETLSATIASALVIGAINIGLILILSLLAFTGSRPANLGYVNVPFLGGRPFDPSILQLIFGVILLAYFGHLSVGNCARVVLRRDPSAHALIWGGMAAQVAVMVIYCIWVLAVNGAIAPQALAGQSGTSLVPLAAEIGPVVHAFGSVFVILGMGMGTIHSSMPLFNLVRERLSRKRWLAVMLPRRRGRLLLRSDQRGLTSAGGDLRLGLTYLGLDPEHSREEGQPQFRLDVQVDGATHHLEMAVAGTWEATALFDRLPALRQHGVRLALEILDASPEHVRLRVSSPLHLTYEGEWYTAGLSMANVFALPDSQRQILTWMTREGVTGQETVSLAQVATHTGQSEAVARTMLNTLVGQGFIRKLEVEGEIRYQPRLVSRRGRQLPEDILRALGDKGEAPARGGPETGFLQRAMAALMGERGRFFLSMAPVAAVFLLTEWLLLTGAESFAEPLSFLGVIVISLLGGIFPVLLLIASRRKGEVVPGVVYRLLGHPLLVTGVYLLFLASLFLHGLVIWENPLQRAAALAVGLLMLGATIAMARRGAFASRVVVELREDRREQRLCPEAPSRGFVASPAERLSRGAQPEGWATFAITASGQPASAEVRLGYGDGERQIQTATGQVPRFSSLRYVNFHLPATQAQELKVWAHRITPEGGSEGLPARLEVHCDGEKREFDLKLSGGQVVLPLTGESCRLEITLTEEKRAGETES
jgi:amino acid permease